MNQSLFIAPSYHPLPKSPPIFHFRQSLTSAFPVAIYTYMYAYDQRGPMGGTDEGDLD